MAGGGAVRTVQHMTVLQVLAVSKEYYFRE